MTTTKLRNSRRSAARATLDAAEEEAIRVWSKKDVARVPLQDGSTVTVGIRFVYSRRSPTLLGSDDIPEMTDSEALELVLASLDAPEHLAVAVKRVAEAHGVETSEAVIQQAARVRDAYARNAAWSP